MSGRTCMVLGVLLILSACDATIGQEVRRNTKVYFESFTGYDLPLQPVGEISEEQAKAAKSYYLGEYDAAGHLRSFASIFDGRHVFFRHEYTYFDNGKLKAARITNEEGVVKVLEFGSDGRLSAPPKHGR